MGHPVAGAGVSPGPVVPRTCAAVSPRLYRDQQPLSSAGRDATLLTAPNFFRLEEAGYRNLANLADHDVYAATTYMFSKKAVSANPRLAEQLIRAHAEAIKRFYDDKSFAMQVMLRYGGARDMEDAGRVYAMFANSRMFEPIPYILKGSVEGVLERQQPWQHLDERHL